VFLDTADPIKNTPDCSLSRAVEPSQSQLPYHFTFYAFIALQKPFLRFQSVPHMNYCFRQKNSPLQQWNMKSHPRKFSRKDPPPSSVLHLFAVVKGRGKLSYSAHPKPRNLRA